MYKLTRELFDPELFVSLSSPLSLTREHECSYLDVDGRSTEWGGRRDKLVASLKACSKSRDLEAGKRLHLAAAEAGLQDHILVANTLLHMYCKCGSLASAFQVFERMQEPDVVTWNALIFGCVENGQGRVGLELFARMRCEGYEADKLTFVAVVKACSSLATKSSQSRGLAMAVHRYAAQAGCEIEVKVASTLLDMHAKCGCMSYACRVFGSMQQCNAVSWNALLFGYADNGQGQVALDMLACMAGEGCKPDALSYVAAIQACASLPGGEKEQKGMAIHTQAASSGLDKHLGLATSLVSLYADLHDMVNGRKVFDGCMEEEWDVAMWNALLFGYAENGEGDRVLKLVFSEMVCPPNARTLVAVIKSCSVLATSETGMKLKSLSKGMAVHALVQSLCLASHSCIGSSLVNMYSRCGRMDEAYRVFEVVDHPDVIMWTSLILGYAENGEALKGLQMFQAMKDQQNLTPDALTYVAVLKVCGLVGALGPGKALHSEILNLGLENALATSLIDFYGECGSWIHAQEVFDRVSSKGLLTWTALISVYTRQGDVKRALGLFSDMIKQQIKPDKVVFLCILSALNHAGLLDKGMECFELMVNEYSLAPDIEHYHCLIDMLGRANRLEEAFMLAKTMPFAASATTWITILGSCNKWKNLQLGKLAFDHLVGVNAGAYVLMANTYRSRELGKIDGLRTTQKLLD